MFEKKFRILLPLTRGNTPECPQKCQPNRSSRLAGYTKHIYEYLVLLNRLSIFKFVLSVCLLLHALCMYIVQPWFKKKIN